MVKFMSLSSGSCGNCYYLGTSQGAILIDAGVSLRRLKKVLQDYDLSLDSFSAILVTHDHLDHIRHLGSFCKRLNMPVYTSETIHRALARHTFTAPTIGPCRKIISEGQVIEIAGMSVRYFVVPHDATQTVGYAIEADGHKFVIMTDVGRMTDEAVEYARQADTVVVESNYDMDMLMGGPYTYELKMRIVQGCGHLSNDECASAIRRFWHPGLRNIFLCHLSENNNTHELAYKCSLDALESLGIPAVIIDNKTKKLLTLAYMSRESLEISIEKGLTCFFSRSRQELWLKGETSGNFQHIVSITADCDKDALEIIVEPDGPACHTGSFSCFENPVWENPEMSESAFSLDALAKLIEGRKTEKKEGSYTTYLFEKGIDKILKKVGEECTEVIIAGKADDKAETIYEISDLTYHVLVLMVQMGISVDDIKRELASRHVIDHKVKQEKMTK